ncbi:PilW family protein [Billgrantia antri]|uniref:Prepilin-type N-terminal cleavage/methylation domain-containing protein n=1 Tax=Billgrantia antri TaxID=2846777 RepID=A0ABS6ZJQ9_9GAMM|nr:prepilin-type N-terminal cleavage/methylation domain-containing protein [Halomonas antri]MBW6390303.1 prepilin-type N-terminal cleavage/methylation domain-containing protein [Halomonas antri]
MVPSGFPRHVSHHQSGFTMVELMVALVIGLIIVLGAGQLFLMGFQTFRQTELLGNKQAALTFATEALIRDVRRASSLNVVNVNGDKFEVIVPNSGDVSSPSCNEGEDVTKRYWVESSGDGSSLYLWVGCNGVTIEEPLAEGFTSNGFPMPTDEGGGVWQLTFRLVSSLEGTGSDEFVFYAVNRNEAIN